jgi:two-component system copper resistance phosphate regulon response regulator CusR
VRILLVEDQSLIGKAVKSGLSEEAFAVDWVTTVADASHLLNEFEYDTLILDIMLSDGSGLDVLKLLRNRQIQTPVLILSARDTIEDKMIGFNLGTDDYLTKPFVFEELLARVKALTKRKYQNYNSVLEAGPLKLDINSRIAYGNDQILNLTSKEFAVLELFLLRKGHVLTRDKIAEHIYTENDEQGSNVIDVFINKLRRKIELVGIKSPIETVRGEGYVIR